MMPSEIKGSCSYRSIFIGVILLVLLMLYVISFIGMDNEFATIHRRLTQTEDASATLHNRTGPKRSFGRRRRGKNYLLIYNNVPKTGGRSLATTIKSCLKKKHKPKIEMELLPKTYRKDIKNLTKYLMELEVPLFVHGHSNFVRLNRSNVLHINVVRDPIDKFISEFYFLRNGDASGIRPQKQGEGKLDNLTIDEYVQNNVNISKDLQIPLSYFFLSEASEDEESNVQTAKKNIDKYFSLVGISEQMDQVTVLLEKLFPDLLPGLSTIYKNKGEKMKTSTSTIGKVEPSAETVAILKNKLKHDYDLYKYIKKRFNYLRKKL